MGVPSLPQLKYIVIIVQKTTQYWGESLPSRSLRPHVLSSVHPESKEIMVAPDREYILIVIQEKALRSEIHLTKIDKVRIVRVLPLVTAL